MQPIVILSLVFLLLTSCGSSKPGLVSQASDSVRIETVEKVLEKTILVPDTVFIQVPSESSRVETFDTISEINLELASSKAVWSSGRLFHTLDVHPTKVPVEIQKEIVFRDSIVYVNQFQNSSQRLEETKVLETSKLTFIQQLQITLFQIMCLSILAYFLARILKNKLKKAIL